MIIKPYNESQIGRLVAYAKKFKITHYTLHAYHASVDATDEGGYTKAHNEDVAELWVHAEMLGVGIENLLEDYPGTDITISSKVMVEGVEHHIPMLDLLIPSDADPAAFKVSELNCDIDSFMGRISAADGRLGPAVKYVSGNSFHFYGQEYPLKTTGFLKMIAAVLVCDREHIADHAWLGFCLARGEFRLRLTAVQSKYKQLPTEFKPRIKASTTIFHNGYRFNLDDEIPF